LDEKKTLATNVSNSLTDTLLESGLNAGAWGGKVLGAGGGGCVLFIAPPDKHATIRNIMMERARTHDLADFQEIPMKFTKLGVNVLFDVERTSFI